MRFLYHISSLATCMIVCGCRSESSGNRESSGNSTASTTTIPNTVSTAGRGSSGAVYTETTAEPILNPNCPGKRLGQYSWGYSLWSQGSTELTDFFATQAGKDWACGDVTINIGDYTDATSIKYAADIVPFIERYRQTSKNVESVVWLSYGDVVSGDGSLMVQFVDTFFAWASSIPVATAATLRKVGLSFDVEHMPAASTATALQRAQSLKSTTNFAPGQLLIQHSIEGKPNPDGTDYVMKYADAAFIMLYRNYMISTKFHVDSNILSRAQYYLQQQCVNCLNDTYASENYVAKITLMVEGSCSPSDYCAKISFCAFDGPDQGAAYLWNTIEELESSMFSTGLVTQAQFTRLFNPLTTYAVHDWTWFRCYAPLSDTVSFPSCSAYSQAAETCRATVGPVQTTPSP